MAQNIIDAEIPETLVPYLYMVKDGKTVDDKVTVSIVAGILYYQVPDRVGER